IGQESREGVEVGTTPDHAAYVIYTSGSTGVPKGVTGLHRGAINRLAWMWRAFSFPPRGGGGQKTGLRVVGSAAGVLGPLLQGVPLVLVPDEAGRDLEQLVTALAAHRVTRIVVVPSLLGALLETYPDLGARVPALRFWVTSGEALTGALARQFHARL